MAGENLQKQKSNVGLLEKVKNVLSKKNPIVEDGKKESTAQNIQIVEANTTATTGQEESVAREFLQKILNDLERNRGEIGKIIFSDDFKKAIKNEVDYTALEREIIEPEKVKIFVEAGAPYQDPKKQEEIVEKRNMLIAKLNSSKEGIRSIDYYDLDIILKTLATNEEWLKKFYAEAVMFSVESSRLNGKKEPGEVLGQIFSYLTTASTLTNHQIKKYQNNCLIPRDKIKELIENDINRFVGDIDKKIKMLIDKIVVARDVQKKEEAVEKSLHYILGILTSNEQEKKDGLTQKMMETIEATNSTANAIVLTRDELGEDFKLYKSLTTIEDKLKEVIEKNKEGDIKASLGIFNEALNKWSGISIEKRVERTKRIYSAYFGGSSPDFNNMQTRIKEGFNLISSQLEAGQLTTEQYTKQCEVLINNINNLITNLYLWESIIRTTKNSLDKIVDERTLTTWDFLKARQEIRAPPIDISKLKGVIEEKKKNFTDRIIEKVQKLGYWLWYGIPVLKATIKGVFWTVYVGSGIKAIKENWHHKYPHTMYPFLSRRTGVIINAIIKRVLAAALFFYIGAGVLPDTWVEETAIKLNLAEPYQKVNRIIKREGKIKKVVWIDQNGKERKINEEDIKKYYGVKNSDNIKYLLSEEGSQVLAYLERLSDYNNKDQRYLLNPQNVDDFVKYIRTKRWGEEDYIVINNKIIPNKVWSPTKVLDIDKTEEFRGIQNLNEDLRKQLALRTKEQKIRELEFLMKGFIIPNNIASYIREYRLDSGEAKLMREIMTQNPVLGSMFQKGRSSLYVKNPKGLLAQIKENNQPIPTTEEEIRQMFGEYLEESMNIEKELAINPSLLSDENISFIIEHKDKFKQGGDYRKIIENIKENYTVNPNMENKFIDYLKEFVSTGIINNDTMGTFIEFLDTEEVIIKKEQTPTEAPKESRRAPSTENKNNGEEMIKQQEQKKAMGRAPTALKPNKQIEANKTQPQKPPTPSTKPVLKNEPKKEQPKREPKKEDEEATF